MRRASSCSRGSILLVLAVSLAVAAAMQTAPVRRNAGSAARKYSAAAWLSGRIPAAGGPAHAAGIAPRSWPSLTLSTGKMALGACPAITSRLLPVVLRAPSLQRGVTHNAKAKTAQGDTEDGENEAEASSTPGDPEAPSGVQRVRQRRSPEEINEFWEKCMEEVDRPSARQMLRLIRKEHPLGIDPQQKGVSNKKDSLFGFYQRVREEHPTKVILARVGDFYEAFGYCAGA